MLKFKMNAFTFLVAWIMAMCLVGCDAMAWIKAHPQQVQEAEKMAEDVGEAGLKAAEADL